MSKHTQGPWELMETQGVMTFPILDIFQSSTGKSVCSVSNSMKAAKELPPDEIDANARLIAAAPELLEALKAIFEDNCFYHKTGDERAYRLATQAIAKAEAIHGA